MRARFRGMETKINKHVVIEVVSTLVIEEVISGAMQEASPRVIQEVSALAAD